MAVIKITAENFEEEVVKSDVPVLVDFWAPWCGPCQMQGPVVDEAEQELAGKLKVGKLNVDEEGSLAQKYNVMSIPTLILFQNGEVAKKEMGFHSLEEIKAMIP
jgi:thioredoxin 1